MVKLARFVEGTFLALALLSAPARAEDQIGRAPASAGRAGKEVPDVPGGDIFGFTSPTDTGKPGDLAYSNENDGRIGKGQGVYGALDSKFAMAYTFADNWWLAGGFFTALHQSSHVTGLPDVDRIGFDGVSIELMHRIIERSSSNPIAATVSVEPRWGQIDSVTGLPSTSVGSTFKFFTDYVVIPDKLYWGGNLRYTIESAQDPLNHRQSTLSAQLLSSTAMTWQASPSLFFGGEIRLFLLSSNWALSHETGRALYIGPTMLWKVTDKVALNITFQPQVYGRSASHPGIALDLDNFERAQFRARLEVAF